MKNLDSNMDEAKLVFVAYCESLLMLIRAWEFIMLFSLGMYFGIFLTKIKNKRLTQSPDVSLSEHFKNCSFSFSTACLCMTNGISQSIEQSVTIIAN